MTKRKKKNTSRREFLQNGSKLAVAGAAIGTIAAPELSIAKSAHAFGSDTIKIGLVGCGGRGTGAANQAMNTNSGNVELHAMADAFENRLEGSLKSCMAEHGGKVSVPKAKQFVGFDAYKKVLDSDIDLVILATPPGLSLIHI